MGKKKTKFTKEFKIEAINLVKKQGYSQAEAAKNLGIYAKNLSRWMSEMNSSAGKNKLSSSSTTDQKEVEQLRNFY